MACWSASYLAIFVALLFLLYIFCQNDDLGITQRVVFEELLIPVPILERGEGGSSVMKSYLFRDE